MNISILLYPDFETLDVFGPVEVFGKVKDFTINFYSLEGGIISNSDNIRIQTLILSDALKCTDVLFIPGGMGSRKEVNNCELIDYIEKTGKTSKFILTVCTGSAILAKTTLLDKRRATSNKRAFSFPVSVNPKVNWVKNARWVEDGNIFTSSGISAGTDMALAFTARIKGQKTAEEITSIMEYNWNSDPNNDEFSSFSNQLSAAI